jgi:tetratricopeptide (TPR) repeat protein
VNYLGNYGHDQYLREWELELGLPWKETAKWVELSPWFEVEKVTTPTLLVCGQDDWNVPLHGSEQLYQALKRLGKETELVIYPGEDHSIGRPSFQIDRFERYLGWFDRFVLGKADAKAEAASIEATSLLGAPLATPTLSDATRARLEADLAAAQSELAKGPGSADAAIWVARRLGYLGRHREAIAVLTEALAAHPDDVRILRHRGHRYLSVRELAKAVADLERAASMVVAKGLPDELEPDGAPNELGVPTSTTQFNIWYHLGLAHYLSGNFEQAAEAYRTCLEKGSSTATEAIARGANDRRVATTDWLWLTLMRLDRRAEAAAALAAVPSDLEVIEDQTYLDRIRLYKGETTPEALLADAQGAVDVATRSYAVGAWYLVRGDAERARAWFERTLVNAQWGSFAVLAAEAEIARAQR